MMSPVNNKEMQGFRDLSEADIERLIDTLDSVAEGELGVAMLVACGERAVSLLRHLLLHGPPKSVYIGRQRAVRALGELGAVAVLIEYLTSPKDICDPMLRYCEEAVENTAARELARWKTEDVFRALLSVVERRALSGAIETLAGFGRAEAVAPIIRHLEDDVARPSAIEALTKLRDHAVDELVNAVRSPEPSSNNENPSSLLRRQAALQVLSSGAVSHSEWERLRFLLYDADSVLAVRAAGVALTLRHETDSGLAIRKLLEVLTSKNWSLVLEAEQLLLKNFDVTCSPIERELEDTLQRQDASSQKLARILRALLRRGEAA